MQKYKGEFQNLCNAFKIGTRSHEATLDKMIAYINHLEHFFVEIYENYSLEEAQKQPANILMMWEMGEEISNRFSVKGTTKK